MDPLTQYALISAGTGILSSIFGGKSDEKAASKAAEAQLTASREATALTKEMWETGREDMAPYREMGTEAMSMLSDFMGIAMPDSEPSDKFGSLLDPFSGEDFEKDPSYQFRLEQGLEAIEGRGSARGKLLSGETDKDLMAYGQGMASTEFQAAFDRYRTTQGDTYSRLFGMAEQGRGAAISTAQLGGQAGRDMSANINLGGVVQAQGYLNQGAARSSIYSGVNQAVQSGLGNLAFNQFMKEPAPTAPAKQPYNPYQGYGPAPPSTGGYSDRYYQQPPKIYT